MTAEGRLESDVTVKVKRLIVGISIAVQQYDQLKGARSYKG
jgi:hypothetical protein